MKFSHLKKRFDFVRVSKCGTSLARRSFVLQHFTPEIAKEESHRFGFTASKKVGSAVRRNRAKRRLRALVQNNLSLFEKTFLTPTDIVFIARHSTFDLPFSQLEEDLANVLKQIKTER